MPQVQLKTKKNNGIVGEFLQLITDPVQREDSMKIIQLMTQISGCEPKMWGSSIIGFGDVHLKYESGRELDWFLIVFLPRKQNLSLHILNRYNELLYKDLLDKLGKHSTGKGCLYIKRLEDVNLQVLKSIIKIGYDVAKKN